jgi:diacylglycerol kinase (ATP)
MIKKRANSFWYAFKGLKIFLFTDYNAFLHLIAAVLAIALGFWLNISALEWCLVTLSIGIVIASEAFNTAIEYLVNLVSPQYNELAGKVKDLASASVFLASIAAAVVGLIIFLPKIMALL